MAKRHLGNTAPYLFDNECRWCFGDNGETLRSTSFGSCVGMVLYSPRHNMGVVAHYSGSLGAKKFHDKVCTDTQEILRSVCPVLPGIWLGWVFGGVSLMKNSGHATTTVEKLTIPLIDLVRDQLRINPYIPINSVKKNRIDPEMQDRKYVGHKGVALNVATGTVTWNDG